MNKLKIILTIITFNIFYSQDISGSYKLSALYATYYNIARYDTPLEFSDTLGLLLQPFISGKINQGEIFRKDFQGPFSEQFLDSYGVSLNVNFNDDGSAEINNSNYPTVQIIDCEAIENVLPISDNLIYTSDLQEGSYIPSTNVIGLKLDEGWPTENDTLPWPQPYRGFTAGSISLIQTGIFDLFPSIPTQTTIPFPIHFGDFNGNGVIDYNQGEGIPAGETLPGFTFGSVLKCTMPSFIPNNGDADLYMEWHAIDGELSQSGLGDDSGIDEDGDGTIFDGIFALEKTQATRLSPSCGNNPVAGDQVDFFYEIGLEDCLDCPDGDCYGLAKFMYIMDPIFEDWGYFLTFNAVNGIMVDDSDHDFNGTDGKLIMQLEPTCVQNIMVRQFIVEFREISQSEEIDISGCTDEEACNYHPCANLEDGSCAYTADCAGRCNGNSYGDECGFCDNNPLNDSYFISADDFGGAYDCSGVCFGPELLDECGICGGDGTPCLEIENSAIIQNLVVYSLYPNPFNPVINGRISFSIPGNLDLRVYNTKGQLIDIIIENEYIPTEKYFSWDGSLKPSGIYFFTAESNNQKITEKVLLIK